MLLNCFRISESTCQAGAPEPPDLSEVRDFCSAYSMGEVESSIEQGDFEGS